MKKHTNKPNYNNLDRAPAWKKLPGNLTVITKLIQCQLFLFNQSFTYTFSETHQMQIQTLKRDCNKPYARNVINNSCVNQALVRGKRCIIQIHFNTDSSSIIFKHFILCCWPWSRPSPRNKPPITQAQVVLHFINSNIRVLNVQRTSPMRIAFTVLANTEHNSTRGTQSKSPGDQNIYQVLQKEEVWPRRHEIKSTFSCHGDSPFCEGVCVCVCVCVCVRACASVSIR